MTPLTYPARPVNGGRLDLAPDKRGDWAVEPKFNGWRVLVHAPTFAAFNRHGKPLSIAGEFTRACSALRCVWLRNPMLQWFDCEGLERRHNLGRGALIVLDAVTEGTYRQRRDLLSAYLETGDYTRPAEESSVTLVPSVPSEEGRTLYNTLRALNDEWTAPYYEGVVMKRTDSPYPMQLRNPEEKYAYWTKHRWR